MINFYHIDSVFECDSDYHFRQAIETPQSSPSLVGARTEFERHM